MKYYVKKQILIKNSEVIVNLLKDLWNLQQVNQDNKFDRLIKILEDLYRDFVIKIRKDLKIKNVMCLAVVKLKETGEEIIQANLFDYELDRYDSFFKIEWQKDEKGNKYIEI